MLCRLPWDIGRDGLTRSGLAPAVRLCRRIVIIGRRWSIHILEHQAQLGDIHLLRAATKLHPQKSREPMLKLFDGQVLSLDGVVHKPQRIALQFNGLGSLIRSARLARKT